MQIKLVSSYFDLKIFLIFDSNIFLFMLREKVTLKHYGFFFIT